MFTFRSSFRAKKLHIRDADPLLTGKKPGNKAKQKKEGKKDKRSHDYLTRNVCPRLDHRSEQKNCIFAMQILC